MKRQQRSDCAAILEFLSGFQHLHPHAPLSDALTQAVAALECCPLAADQAIHWLQLDSSESIGRLKRSQVVQIAQSMYRFWQKNLADQGKPTPTV